METVETKKNLNSKHFFKEYYVQVFLRVFRNLVTVKMS